MDFDDTAADQVEAYITGVVEYVWPTMEFLGENTDRWLGAAIFCAMVEQSRQLLRSTIRLENAPSDVERAEAEMAIWASVVMELQTAFEQHPIGREALKRFTDKVVESLNRRHESN